MQSVASALDYLRRPRDLLINGRLVPAQSGKTFVTMNPSTGLPLAEVADAGGEDIDLAVRAARTAFEGPWSTWKPFARQQALLKLADLVDKHFEVLGMLDTLDMGGPVAYTAGKKMRMVALLRYYAGLATSIHGQTIGNSVPGSVFSWTTKEPVGVVGAIIPWNGPLGIAIWKIAPALAAGCTVVLKSAEQAPLSPLLFGELCLEAGIPPGVVNIVSGGSTAGAALATHPGVDKVSFTGSTEVGQKIIQASAHNVKRLSLELGGKSPNIVFADADLDAAVPGCAMAVFANSGQVCSAGTRLFVQRPVFEEFMEKLKTFTHGLRVGDPCDPQTQLGPLVSSEQLQRVSRYLELAAQEGATALTQRPKKWPDAMRNGYFVEPTVFTGVTDDMRIAREEIFGPVISAFPFDEVDEVVRRANDTKYGLASGVWTSSVDTALQVSSRIRAGSVWVNCYQAMDPAVPFGGYKMSGYGRESGSDHIEQFLETKSVWMKTA